MATINITRRKGRHKVKCIEAFDTVLDLEDVATSGDTYQLAVLPPKTYIKSLATVILTANDAATSAAANIGIDGGSELEAALDLTQADGTAETTDQSVYLETGGVLTYTPTYTGAVTEGKVLIHVEYTEIGKASGAFTRLLPL